MEALNKLGRLVWRPFYGSKHYKNALVNVLLDRISLSLSSDNLSHLKSKIKCCEKKFTKLNYILYIGHEENCCSMATEHVHAIPGSRV